MAIGGTGSSSMKGCVGGLGLNPDARALRLRPFGSSERPANESDVARTKRRETRRVRTVRPADGITFFISEYFKGGIAQKGRMAQPGGGIVAQTTPSNAVNVATAASAIEQAKVSDCGGTFVLRIMVRLSASTTGEATATGLV